MKACATHLMLVCAALSSNKLYAEEQSIEGSSSSTSEPASDAFDTFVLMEEDRAATLSTGSTLGLSAKESASATFVIERETIMTMGAQSLADVLRRVPGMLVLDYVTGHAEPVMRGFGNDVSSRILFLLDGRPVLRDFYGTTLVDYLGVALGDIERVEVVFGPASAVYGANAFSGVVNVITRTAPTEGRRVGATARGGLSSTARGQETKASGPVAPLAFGSAEYGENYGPLALRLSAHGGYTGVTPSTDADPTSQSIPFTQAGGIIDLSTLVRGTAMRLTANFAYGKSRIFYLGESAPQDSVDGAVSYRLQKQGLLAANDEVSLLVAWRALRSELQQSWSALPGVIVPQTPLQMTGDLIGSYASPWYFKNRTSVGIQLKLIDVDFAPVDPRGRFQHIYGVFLEHVYKPISWFSVQGSVRVETRESQLFRPLSRLTASPRGALVFMPHPLHAIRAEVSSAFRNPSIVENFETLSVPASGTTLLRADPTLAQEQHLLASLGYQGEVKQQQLRVELYYGRKTQLVSLQPVSDLVPLPIAFTNLDAQDYFGGTLAASGRIVRNLDWFAQYALYLTRQLPSGTFTEQSPTHSAGLGGSYHWRDLTLSLQLYYQSGANQSRFVAGRLVTGLLTAHSLMINPFISYKVKPAGLELVLSGTNVADIRFGGVFVRDFVGFGAERRGPRVWLEVRGEWN